MLGTLFADISGSIESHLPPDPKAGGAAAAAPKLKPAGLAELAGAPNGVAVDWVGAAEPKAGAAPEPRENNKVIKIVKSDY